MNNFTRWSATFVVLIATGMALVAFAIAARLIAEMMGITF